MANKIKTAALGTIFAKAGQQIASDLVSTFPKETTQGFLSYSAQQGCKIGAAGLAAYTVDEAVSCAEELIPVKPLRGLTSLTASTLGVAAVMHFAGDYLGAPEAEGFKQTLTNLITNYQNSITNLVAWNPTEVDAGYLTGAVLTIKSGARWIKNIGQSIGQYADKKRAKDKFQRRNEIKDLDSNSDPSLGL